jgi:PilZ domain
MSNPSQPTDSNDKWLTQDLTGPYPNNKRKSTRYVRNDIGVTVSKISLFNFSFIKNWGIAVKLVDISSRGVLISSPMRLAVRKKIQLNLRFSDFKEFDVTGSIVRKSPGDDYVYGIKFDRINNSLADHILKTQRKLKFK